MNRGATGQMSELGRGWESAVEWSESVEQEGRPFPRLGPGDGEALRWGSGFELERGRYYRFSARNLARICAARWRAAWSS